VVVPSIRGTETKISVVLKEGRCFLHILAFYFMFKTTFFLVEIISISFQSFNIILAIHVDVMYSIPVLQIISSY